MYALASTFPPKHQRSDFIFWLGGRSGYGLVADYVGANGELAFLLGSFGAFAPSQQFSVLRIFPHVSHLCFWASVWFVSA